MVSLDLKKAIQEKKINGRLPAKKLTQKDQRIMDKYTPIIDEAIE